MFIFMITWFNEKIGNPSRRKHLVPSLYPYLGDSKTVLDLGASCGRLAKQISQQLPGTVFTGVDTHIQAKTFIPIEKYDGKNLPFPDASFDCVMIIDVLHHDECPESILLEAKRVSKKYILIKDHYWVNKIDFMFLKYYDYIGNKPYGIALPYNFLKLSDWKGLIDKTGVEILKSETFRFNIVDPCKHIIYLLKK